jgi:hypothetical protein
MERAGRRREMTADNLIEYELFGEVINDVEADTRFGLSK